MKISFLNVYLTFTMLCVCCLQLSVVVVVVLAVFARLVLKRWFQVRERSHLSLSLSKPSTMAFLPFTISISLSISSVSCCCSSADFKSSDIETQKLYFNDELKKKTETVELEMYCVTGLLQQSAQFFLHTRLLLLQLLSPGSGRTTWKKVIHYIRGTSILQIKNIHF